MSQDFEDKLDWLLCSHLNLFHADMVNRALHDKNVCLKDFITGYTAIYTSECNDGDEEFTPTEFKNV